MGITRINTFEAKPGQAVELRDNQYPDAFMFAGPSGARVAEKPAVPAGISKGQELFRSLGHRRTRLASLSETRLDEHYTLVRARFVWRFEKAAAPIDVDSTFEREVCCRPEPEISGKVSECRS